MEQLDNDRLVWMFTQMLRIREFEERVKRTFEEHPGVIRGHTHLADGAEASIVGSLATMQPGDQLMATYRCHGYPIALGTDTKAIMAEIYGRKDGLCGGYGGSMHLIDPGRGFMGTSGIVGQGIPQATGLAFAAQTAQGGPGRPVVLRRRRLQAGGLPRVAQPRLAVEAAGRVRDGEQQLQRVHALRAGGRERRRRRAAVGQGRGLQHARRHRGRRGSGRGVRDRGGGVRPRSRRRRADARGVEGVPPVRPRQHHRPARRAAPLPRARGDHHVRQPRGVRGRASRRPRSPVPRTAGRAGRARPGACRRDRKQVTEEMEAAVQFGLDSPFPEPEAAARQDYVYA